MTTEIIDKLYLELSQVSRAQTERERTAKKAVFEAFVKLEAHGYGNIWLSEAHECLLFAMDVLDHKL